MASDLIINIFIFNDKYAIMHTGWYIIYSIFTLIVNYGKWLIPKVLIKNVLMASLVAAFRHGLLADFIIWTAGGTNIITLLPLTKTGLGCYDVMNKLHRLYETF